MNKENKEYFSPSAFKDYKKSYRKVNKIRHNARQTAAIANTEKKAMSIELSPLETLKLLKDFVLEDNKNGLDRTFIIGSCDILEQELKDKEKKDKILDIIKNNKDMRIAVLSSCKKWDEYDLLKEVLL